MKASPRKSPAGRLRRAVHETLEARRMLSAYTISTLGSLPASSAPFPNENAVTMDSAGNFYGAMNTSGVNGASPFGQLSMDSSGNVFGTTVTGGANNAGTIFEASPPPATHVVFTTPPSSFVDAAVFDSPILVTVEDANGDVVGSDRSTITLTISSGPPGAVLHGAISATAIDGVATFSNVSLDPTGTYTLTAIDGGLTAATSAPFGVFASSPADRLTLLANLDAGTNPGGGVVLDSEGNLYAIGSGGVNGDGTIFELPKGAHVAATLASFNQIDGMSPAGPLTMDSSGNLYGTALAGGAGDGVVFELAKGSSVINIVAVFNGIDGQNPSNGVVIDSAGNIYGTTHFGGAHGLGTLFEIAHGTNAITTLVDIGAQYLNELNYVTVDDAGNLYATEALGGADHDGTILELVNGSTSFTTLASFNGTNGSDPGYGLVLDSAGNLYGGASGGGANGAGVVFELAKGSSVITTLANFDLNNGSPDSPLIPDPAGDLYGTAADQRGYVPEIVQPAEQNALGSVFEVVHNSGAVTTLTGFNGMEAAPAAHWPWIPLVTSTASRAAATLIAAALCSICRRPDFPLISPLPRLPPRALPAENCPPLAWAWLMPTTTSSSPTIPPSP